MNDNKRGHKESLISLVHILLGRDHPHATGQSHGESRVTAQDDQTQGTKKSHELVARSGSQGHNKPNVHAGMVPMAQPIGGWHVTSMTGRLRSTLPKQMSHGEH